MIPVARKLLRFRVLTSRCNIWRVKLHKSTRPVPTEIAQQICEAIRKPLETIEKSFVDMRKLHGRFERADGEHWNSFSGLIGEAAGMDADSKGFLKEHALTSVYSAAVKVQIEYIVY